MMFFCVSFSRYVLRSLTVLEAKYNFLPAIPPCICSLPLERLLLDSNQV
jgi:hypothetical protein